MVSAQEIIRFKIKNAEVISLLSLLAMTGILAKAFTLGNFSSEDSKILAKPWGIVSLMSL
jgi:hypothetical protein